MANNEKIPYFCRVVLQNFPFIEEDFDALTTYQLISKVVEYLNKVIKSQNTLVDNVNNLSSAFQQLHDYVEHYFENLDVQEEINNKLDQMAEDGTLQEIITAYIQANVAWTFDTVADMKLSENLIAGSYARTLGFYAVGDGGGSIYKISDTGTANEMDVIAVGNLYANLIHEPNYINAVAVGCKVDDNTVDNATIINGMITKFNILTLYFPSGEYFIKKPIVITHGNVVLKGDIKRTRITKTTADGVDITIETSKGTTYNLNNYDMNIYIGKATSDASTVARVHIDNLGIKCYDPTDTSYGIVTIGSGYTQLNNLNLQDYNTAILSDDSFALNIKGIEALTFGGNRNAVKIVDSTAVYISDSYLNAGNFSVLAMGSRVYADNIACDAHGVVYNIQDSYYSMINSRCETYATIMSTDNSQVNINNCDLEGHGLSFNYMGQINHNSVVNIDNTNFRYRVYEGEPPASIHGFYVENSSVCNVKAIYNIQDGVTVNDGTATAGQLYVVKLNTNGIKGALTNETGFSNTNAIYSHDGYVDVYLLVVATNALTANTSTKVATLSRVPLPTSTVRFNAFSSASNAYTATNPCYVSINTSGEISITAPESDQKYFNMCFKYKIS